MKISFSHTFNKTTPCLQGIFLVIPQVYQRYKNSLFSDEANRGRIGRLRRGLHMSSLTKSFFNLLRVYIGELCNIGNSLKWFLKDQSRTLANSFPLLTWFDAPLTAQLWFWLLGLTIRLHQCLNFGAGFFHIIFITPQKTGKIKLVNKTVHQ